MDKMLSLYIEITSECNLSCVMCSRNHWKNETTGHMDKSIFDDLMQTIPDSVERVFFGGVGEPLFHPDIVEMIRTVKSKGRQCELITNGTLLTREMSWDILKAGLDVLWISLDSLKPVEYDRIRKGAEYGSTMDNIWAFRKNKVLMRRDTPGRGEITTSWREQAMTELGISFVMMQSNIDQLKDIITRGPSFGIDRIKVTHLLPYHKSMIDEICYKKILEFRLHGNILEKLLSVDIPVIDTEQSSSQSLCTAFSRENVGWSVMGEPVLRKEDYCRFVREGVVFVRWDGEVSPCMALLHDNTVFQMDKQRDIRACSFGNVKETSLSDIWKSSKYTAFRSRVTDFNFPPCAHCGNCELFEDNETDCFGSDFPACGACLWAQGLIQCP